MKKGQVIKGVGGSFNVYSDGDIYNVVGRKKLKTDKILVGDYVEFDAQKAVIEKVMPRINELNRPPLANVTQGLIVIAPIPKPDYLLVDKMLIKFMSLNIKPFIIINKIDICALNLIEEVTKSYQSVAEVYMITALDRNTTLEVLNPILSGKFSVLTGQSAVGKTSILKNLVPNADLAVGEMSKNQHGKNTTRHSEIFVLENGGRIADTPGFTAFDLDGINKDDVLDFTPEIFNLSKQCKFNDCDHIKEAAQICAVKRALESGELDRKRYERFVTIYNAAKSLEEKKYE